MHLLCWERQWCKRQHGNNEDGGRAHAKHAARRGTVHFPPTHGLNVLWLRSTIVVETADTLRQTHPHAEGPIPNWFALTLKEATNVLHFQKKKGKKKKNFFCHTHLRQSNTLEPLRLQNWRQCKCWKEYLGMGLGGERTSHHSMETSCWFRNMSCVLTSVDVMCVVSEYFSRPTATPARTCKNMKFAVWIKLIKKCKGTRQK